MDTEAGEAKGKGVIDSGQDLDTAAVHLADFLERSFVEPLSACHGFHEPLNQRAFEIPEAAHKAGHVLDTWVCCKARVVQRASGPDHDKGWRLPGVVLGIALVERLGLGLAEAVHGFQQNPEEQYQIIGLARPKRLDSLLAQSRLIGRTADPQSGQVFDTPLTRVGCFPGADRLRHMAGKGESLLLRLVRDGEIGIAGQLAVNLDEIRALFLERSHQSPAPFGIYCHESTGAGAWVWAIDHCTAGHNPRADSLSVFDVLA